MKTRYHIIALGILLFFAGQSVYAQKTSVDSLGQKVNNAVHYLWNRRPDTSYIGDFTDQLAVKLLGVNKYTFFQVKDGKAGRSIAYRPELGLNLGLGVAYDWFSLDVTFNFGLREDNIPNSNFIDFQAVIFSQKLLIEGTLKYYLGYQIQQSSGFNKSLLDPSRIRPDIRSVRLGMQLLYAFNYDKFSLKAPFVFNEAQRKSAGSPIAGLSFSSFNLDADSSIIPPAVQDFFDPKLHLENVSSLSMTLNAGYIYTYVWKKHWFLTLGVIPGLSLAAGDYRTQFREPLDPYLSIVFKGLGALGYNSSRWFFGAQLIGDVERIRIDKKLQLWVGHSKLKFFAGYRFPVKKRKRH